MMIPVRCFTCGRVIGSDYQTFEARTTKGESTKKVLDELGIERFCCRRMILSQVDLVREAARYE